MTRLSLRKGHARPGCPVQGARPRKGRHACARASRGAHSSHPPGRAPWLFQTPSTARPRWRQLPAPRRQQRGVGRAVPAAVGAHATGGGGGGRPSPRRASGGAARKPLCEGSCWRVATLPRAPRAERGRGAVSGASCPRPPPPRRPALRRHPAVLACPRARVRCRRPLTAVTNYFFLSLFSFFFPTLFLPSSRPGCAWHARHTASNQLWGPHRGHPRA